MDNGKKMFGGSSMNPNRELVESAGHLLASLRRTLDDDGIRSEALLQEAVYYLERLDDCLGGADAGHPIWEVVHRYLARLRIAVEDLLACKMRNDPGCEEILAGEVLPLSEGLEGLCRSLSTWASASHPAGSREA